MAYGFSTVIPLQTSKEDGFYALTKTLAENTKQNFKNLLLTAPGERVMIPDFGVGLKHYLFDIPAQPIADIETEIFSKITEQIDAYMPFIKINNIEFFEENPNVSGDEQTLAIKILYEIPQIGLTDAMTVSKANII